MRPEDRRLEPRKQPRQIRAELTRERILTAAAHVFAEFGYAAGTTNRIAERARVSIGSLYQYFPNKDAVLAELLTRHLAPQRVVPGPEDRTRPLVDVVRDIVLAALEHHRDDPRLLRLMIEEGPRSRALVEQIGELRVARVGALHELLASHPEVIVEDVETAAAIIDAGVELIVHQLAAAPAPLAAERLERELVAMLMRYLTGTGLTADGPPHPAAQAH
ncbi:TetR/AcrR family transcriptional regulator [Streptomyces sp. HNM0575]|uniref:TetR/AcrR family transcriptional regulator n=1 Tax=Streptomyces sp. HNM0575 TaxID=2716338 RepID=UPI00145FC192|nr:TetR/AcrR family transcriptional regulator [Streptomyces sp. HNM0575]NLU73397.1 TetR/AcrR family transcriptional regulator [Streptomyces sp. HNM0575]